MNVPVRTATSRKSRLSQTMLNGLMVLLAFSGTALAQIEPALPGYIEYDLTANNLTWVETSDPIATGIYVEDLLTDRLNQPVGRGAIGTVTYTAFDPDYNEMAAMVYFGHDYSVGLVFPELTAVEIVPAPEPSTLLLLLPGILLWRSTLSRRPGAKATSL